MRVFAASTSALLITALAAGCGGGSSGAPAGNAGDKTGASGAATSTTPSSALPANAADSAEFGLSGAEIERRQVKVEGLIRSCMRGQGFDYVPVDPATLRAAMESNSRPSGVSEKEFRAQYGYGITTLYEAQLTQAQNSQGEPNKKVRAALPAADRVAYDRALYGDNPGATFAAALDSEDLTGLGGCTKQSVDAVFPANEVRRLRLTGQDAVGERALQDPRVVEAIRGWSTCMRSAGHTYAKPDDIKADLQGKLGTIVGAAPRTAPVGSDPAAVAPYDKATLAALQKTEIAVATADFACAAKRLKATKDKVEAEIAKTIGG